MRVTLDLDVTAPDRPKGRLFLDGPGEALAFDGWLDLMRVIESLASAQDGPGARQVRRSDRET